MAFKEFDLDSVITPQVSRESYKLEGMGTAISTLNSSNRSTEDMIAGAVTSLGNANRNIMFVNSSLEALDDRLAFAGKVASAVNPAVVKGAEGFSGVKILNPWEYAIEGKAKEFFKRIWDAIRTACRKVIDAIVYFIKWVGNAIASVDVKAQVKDYEYFLKNKSMIEKYSKAAGVGKKTFQSLDWALKGDDVLKLLTKMLGVYNKTVNVDKGDLKVISNAARIGLKTLKEPKDYAKAFSSIFGISFLHTDGGLYKHATKHVNGILESINKDLEEGLSSVFGKSATGKINYKELVLGKVTKNGGKVVTKTCEEVRKLTGDFSILSAEWLANGVKKAVATAAKNQQEFTKYTKAIDDVAKRFDSVVEIEGQDKSGASALSSLTARLANARIRYNSVWSNLMLTMESVCLRYRKTAHIALKQYIRAAKGSVAKTEESLSQESVESLFNALSL